MRRHLVVVIDALGVALRLRSYRYLAAGLFAFALAVYVFTLPAVYTGGVIGLVALDYLNPELVGFSIALAALFSLSFTLNIYGFRARLKQRSVGIGLGAMLSSLAPAGVCCTPLVPSALAIMGASTPQIFGLTGRIQGVFATYEFPILALAVLLLLVSLRLAARGVVGSCPIPERSLSANGPKREPRRESAPS